MQKESLEGKVSDSPNYLKTVGLTLGALAAVSSYPIAIHYFPNLGSKEEVAFVENYGFPIVRSVVYAGWTLAAAGIVGLGGLVAAGLYMNMLEVDEQEEKDLAGDEFIDKEYTRK